MNTEIVKVQTALSEFERIEAGLADLRTRFGKVVFDVTTNTGMRDAKEARKECREPRLLTEQLRKDAKAPLLSLGKQLDAKSQYIQAEIRKIEDPIDQQIKLEEEKAKRAEFDEQQRIIGIKEAIHNLETIPAQMAGKTSAEIAKRAEALKEYDLSEWAAEFIVEAERAREQAVAALRQLYSGAMAQERIETAKAPKAALEAEELAKLRAEKIERDKADAVVAEAKRIEIERERIRAEEQAKIAAAEQKRINDEAARLAAEHFKSTIATNVRGGGNQPVDGNPQQVEAAKISAVPGRLSAHRPLDQDIVDMLCDFYAATPHEVIDWLSTMDFAKLVKEIVL